MRLLDLFSGIGGFSLGLERAGFRTVAFCEIEPYPRAVLAKHWPGVPIYEDVRTLSADTLRRDGVWPIDVIAGGFPCQDLSYAGKRAGIEGERSGLWSEFARLIGEVRPRFAIMENVPGLLSAGHGRVLGDLAALGYDAVWDCVPASAVGAPHRRDRVWIVAYAPSERRGEAGRDRPDEPAPWTSGRSEDVADAGSTRSAPRIPAQRHGQEGQPEVAHDNRDRRGAAQGGDVCDPSSAGLSDGTSRQQESFASIEERLSGRDRSNVSYTTRPKRARQRAVTGGQQSGLADSVRRQPEPRLGGMADGLPDWLDSSLWLEEPEGVPRVATGIENRASRLKALGNSIVPQVAFLIGQAVMESTR
jgi:DNA (cytosine-5)-methyltransferase 1